MIYISWILILIQVSLTVCTHVSSLRGRNITIGGHDLTLGPLADSMNCSIPYESLLRSHNKSLTLFTDAVMQHCTFDDIHKRSEYDIMEPPTKNLTELKLHGLINSSDNTVLGIATNKTWLSLNTANILSDYSVSNHSKRDNTKNFSIVELNDNTIEGLNPHNRLIARGLAAKDETEEEFLKKRGWSNPSTYVYLYAAGGATLKFIQIHTESAAVQKTLDAYLSLAYSASWFVAQCARVSAEAMMDVAREYGARRYGAFGARGRQNVPSILPAKRDCPSGSPEFCYDYLAPNTKVDICSSSVNVFDVDDYIQAYDWFRWFCARSDKSQYWGTTSLHLYWSINNGKQAYWVLLPEIRPDTKDTQISYGSCDDGHWT